MRQTETEDEEASERDDKRTSRGGQSSHDSAHVEDRTVSDASHDDKNDAANRAIKNQ
jgi:hypothetical protein